MELTTAFFMSDLQFFSAAALTVVLVVAATAKLRAPARFRSALSTYAVLPQPLVGSLVYAIPALELSGAFLQWVPALQPAVSIGITGMLVGFTLLLLLSLLRNEGADCGCFGTAAPEKVSWFSIARNIALIALALAAVFGVDGPGGRALPAILAGLGAGLVILLLDQALTLLSGSHRPQRSRE